MHLTVHQMILIAALVFGLLATLGVPDLPRCRWGWACLTTVVIALFFS